MIREFFRELSTRDRAFIFWVILGALFLSSVPYLFGVIAAGEHYAYLGLYPLGSADTNVYYSFIRQAMDGDIFIRNLHTGEPQNGTIFHPLWLLLGWASSLFQLSPILVFHLARLVVGAAFLLFFYFFLSRVFSDSRRRNIAFFLAAFSSGIGVFFSIGVSVWDPIQGMLLLPADQWITESNTFLTLMHSPLFLLSQLLLLVLLWCFLEEERIKNYFLVGGALFLLVLMHPYDLVTVGVVLPAFLVLRLLRDPTLTAEALRRSFRRLVLLALCSLPPLLAFFVGARNEIAIGGWTKQNVTTSPMLHSYILGYGLVLIFAVVGCAALRKTQSRAQLLVLTWTVVSLLLLYVPIQINRRMSNGLHLALVILAAAGVDLFWSWFRAHRPRRELARHISTALLGWILGFGFFFSTLTVIVKSIYWEASPSTSIYYLSKPVARGMDWLEAHESRSAVLLAHSYHGNILPARTGLRVFVGHGHQTIDWDEKRRLVTTWFFRTNADDEKKAQFLRENGITTIFFSDLENRIGAYDPSSKSYLTPIFRNSGVTIYRVLQDDENALP